MTVDGRPPAPTPPRRRSRPSSRPTSTPRSTRHRRGFTGAVTVNVRDLGGGVWSVEFVRNSTDAGTERHDQRRRRRHRQAASPSSGAATVANTGGGVFQVGANVTANEPDHACRSTTCGSPAAPTRRSPRSRTSTSPTPTQLRERRSRSSTARSPRCRALRGQLGAVQNRFQSTIANLQVTTENLSASECRSVTPTWRSRWSTSPSDQILLQAGTAMLAQANAAPQTDPEAPPVSRRSSSVILERGAPLRAPLSRRGRPPSDVATSVRHGAFALQLRSGTRRNIPRLRKRIRGSGDATTEPMDWALDGSRRRSADAHQYEHHGVERLPQLEHHQRHAGEAASRSSRRATGSTGPPTTRRAWSSARTSTSRSRASRRRPRTPRTASRSCRPQKVR